jgi:hypothetical protein
MESVCEIINSSLSEDIEDEGFDFKNKNHKVTFNPNSKKNADTRIFDEEKNFRVRKILLPKSNVMSYNLYDIRKMDINKALKHKKNMAGEPVEYGKLKSDSSNETIDSIDYFVQRSAQYIKQLLGERNVDIISYPQTSKNPANVGFESFNHKMCSALRKIYPSTSGIRFVPELVVKNVRGIYVNVDLAK